MRGKVEIFLFALIICIIGLLSFGQSYSNQVLNGVKLWVAVILPALFPYFFLTGLLSSLSVTGKLSLRLSPVTRKLFNTGGVTGYAFFMSVISGYPIGAKIVSDLTKNGLLSDAESVRASALCSTSSPMFLMGSVGSIMFNNSTFGILLFICHFISAITVGIIFSFYKKNLPLPSEKVFLPQKTDNVLYDCIFSAVNSILFVGGLITLFYLFTEILLDLKILSPLIFCLTKVTGDETLSTGVVLGLFECTKGLKYISACKTGIFTLPIVCALCGFGGLSVITQSIAYLKQAKIKVKPFIIAKIISALTSFVIGFIFSLIFL